MEDSDIKQEIITLKHSNFTALGDNYGYVSSELDAFEVLREFETATTSKFCVFYSKDFARKGEFDLILIHTESLSIIIVI